MEELVSVILTTYNRKNTIVRAIESVLNQTYKNIELIIVDDASTDGTFDIISEHYGEDERIIYIINDVNMGPSVARNVGADAARGKWIAFQDSDDVWHPDKLEKQMTLVQGADEHVGMIYSQMNRYWNNGAADIYPPKDIPMEYKSGNIHPYVLIHPLCGTISMLIRKECFEQIGGFATDIHSLEDYEFSIRISKEYDVLLYDEPLVDAYETVGSVGKRNEEKIRVQCLIMDMYRESLEQYGLKEVKMRTVWNEAMYYDCIQILINNVEPLLNDVMYAGTFLELGHENGLF